MADNTKLAREVGAKIKYLRLKQGLSQESQMCIRDSIAADCADGAAVLQQGMAHPHAVGQRLSLIHI